MMWFWGLDQELAFCRVKEELTKTTVLALYDPLKETKVSADASSFGLGAVILQENRPNQWRPIAFASRAMTDVEQRYAQIEKEALTVVCACEKFQDYMFLGRKSSLKLITSHLYLYSIPSTCCPIPSSLSTEITTV